MTDENDLPIDGIAVTVGGAATGTLRTDGTGFYAFLRLASGDQYTATVNYNQREITKPFVIEDGKVTTLDFSFRPSLSSGWMLF